MHADEDGNSVALNLKLSWTKKKNLIPSSFIVSNVKSSMKSNTNAEQLQAIALEAGKVHPSSLIAYFLVC